MADSPLCQLDQQIVRERIPDPKSPETIVLDLGCGTGRLAIPLLERGYNVVGIDLSHRMLQRMIEKIRDSIETIDEGCQSNDLPKGPSLSAIEANLVELDCLASNSADHAICMFSTLGMIQGRDNRMQFLRHVSRVVRPGGQFIVHVHRRWAALQEPRGLARLANSLWNSWRIPDYEFGDATYAYRGLEKMFMHRFSASELRRDLSSCGWKIQRLEWVSLDGAQLTSSSRTASGMIVTCVNGH